MEYFLGIFPPLWKSNDSSSYNGIHFDDRRHLFESEDVRKVYDLLSFLCERQPEHGNGVCTNVTKFYKNKFNNYENNYWWPHLDEGYTGIVYLNIDDDVSGTNLYECLDVNYVPKLEHQCPWISKTKFNLIKTLQPKFNRLVLFDAKKFYHGMNICNDMYFADNYRFNQVFFFVDS